MIEQIKKFDNNVIALSMIDAFTKEDVKSCTKLFQEKLAKGFKQVNLLIKVDELKVSESSTKAFFEEIIIILRNYKELKNLAIVGHSKILKAYIPIDNFFFERLSKGSEERYFDISQMDAAIKFVNPT
jgi:hypothetical protein